jgi:hypothetical protein
VQSGNGLTIARVLTGSTLDFEQQPAGAASATKISGKLEKQGGRFILTDVTAKTTFEIQGENLEKSVGQCIAVTGSSDPTTPALIHLVTYNTVSCKKLGIPASVAGAGAGAAAGAGGAAGGAGAGGLSTTAIAGIVIAGAAAGGLGAAAATGAFSSGHAPPVSAP